jgi:hypothetical protein
VRGFLLIVAVLVLWPARARAERELIVPFHDPGHLVLDQLSGLRLSADDGMSYAGPAGFAVRTTKVDALAPGAPASETSTTELWLAPSADVFVTEHLSLGGRIELAHRWGSVDDAGGRIELPSATAMTFLGRVGFYAAFTDRIGLWPRAGIGYASAESSRFASTGSAPIKETERSMLLEVDLSLVYRFDETFFLRAGPEVGVTLGGRLAVEESGLERGGGSSTLQVSALTAFGMNLEL